MKRLKTQSRYADVMALRGLVYQLTGDEEVAATKLTPTRVGFFDMMHVSDPADVALNPREGGYLPQKTIGTKARSEISIGPLDRLRRKCPDLRWRRVHDDEIELWMRSGFGALGTRPRMADPPNPGTTQGVFGCRIGAGMGGLNARRQLKHAGVFRSRYWKKNPGVGRYLVRIATPGRALISPSRNLHPPLRSRFSYPKRLL